MVVWQRKGAYFHLRATLNAGEVVLDPLLPARTLLTFSRDELAAHPLLKAMAERVRHVKLVQVKAAEPADKPSSHAATKNRSAEDPHARMGRRSGQDRVFFTPWLRS